MNMFLHGEDNHKIESGAFAERVGQERFEAEVKDLTMPVDFSLETMQEFIDWQRATP